MQWGILDGQDAAGNGIVNNIGENAQCMEVEVNPPRGKP